MVKAKVKKNVSKNAQTKATRKRAGRPTLSSTSTAPETADSKVNQANGNGASHLNGDSQPETAADGVGPDARLDAGSIKTKSGVDLTEKVRELLLLAKEQGHLTYDDINDALPENIVTPEDLDQIYTKLANLEIEIVDQAEVDRVKAPEAEEEEEKGRLDILDDPVRMYLRQMGKVPLLTREQEVAICKRIEEAENEQKRIIYSFGFAAKEHIALAEKLISEPPKERFDRVIVDKKVESRDRHLKALRLLVKKVRDLDQQVDEKYAEWQETSKAAAREKAFTEFKKLDKKLQDTFPKFFYKQKVIEEMILVTQNIHDKIQASLRAIGDFEKQRKSEQQQAIIKSERQKIKALEEFARMPYADYLKAYEMLNAYAAKAHQAKTEMAEANLRLVISIGKKYTNRGLA